MEENFKKLGIKVKATPFFKIHKEQGKNIQVIDLKKQFDFIPERILIERMSGRNNVIRVVAFLEGKKPIVK